MNRKKWSKNNPRPIPIDYKVDSTRERFPAHMFNKSRGNKPIPSAMEAYYKRKYRYPLGVIPIYVAEDKEE